MRVKKFEAKNMKEALQMVKNELGPDAVILAARDNRKSFGIAGETSVEITAAVSDSTLQKKQFVESRMTTNDRQKFANTDARTQREIINKMLERKARENEQRAQLRPVMTQAAAASARSQDQAPRKITQTSYIDIPDEEVVPTPRRREAFERATGRNVRELLNGFDQDFDDNQEQWQQRPVRKAPAAPIPQPKVQAQPENPYSDNALSRIRNAAREAWQAGFFGEEENSRKVAQAKAAQAPQVAQGGLEMVQTSEPQLQDIANLKNEISRLQEMINGFQKVPQSFVTMHPGADFGIPYELSFMYQKLVEGGVTIDHTVEILQAAAKEIDPVQMKKRPIVDAWVARWFLNSIKTNSNPWQGRVHIFVGGAGSGKTSTLVKVASQLVVKEKKKVAILSTDSMKVGAVDQMKIYCQILNVPFAVLRSRKDWEWVLSQLGHVDHILVDFPGFQLRELDEIHLLKSLLPPAEVHATTHFCVSATSKDGDAYEMARRYKVTDYSDLIVTNLDQSVQHGIIYNLFKKTGKPLHSFGIGNRIPEDFELATKERVLDLLFKLTKIKKETAK